MERKVRGEPDHRMLGWLTLTQVHLVKICFVSLKLKVLPLFKIKRKMNVKTNSICFVSAESQTSPENESGDDGEGSRPDIPKEEAGGNGQTQSGPD